jgi:transcriptional regulator with XRE-family HTH domain
MITYCGVIVNHLSLLYAICVVKEAYVQTMGDRLEQARKRRVMSQEELATAAGVPVVTISRIENGHTEAPRPSTTRKLAAALGVEPAWLVFGEESVPEKWAA